jgi:hypothetical protein
MSISTGVREGRLKESANEVSHEQRAQIRFMYEKYQGGRAVESFSFPVEVHLLFIQTGHEVEETLGDYP